MTGCLDTRQSARHFGRGHYLSNINGSLAIRALLPEKQRSSTFLFNLVYASTVVIVSQRSNRSVYSLYLLIDRTHMPMVRVFITYQRV